MPDSPGEDALFGNGGTNSVLVAAPVNPSSWLFQPNGQDYVIVGAPVVFAGAGLVIDSPELIAISNNLGGSSGVIKNGVDGTLALYGTNTYTGGTTVNSGTLSVDVDANLGALSGPLTLGNGTLNTKTTFATNRAVTLTGNASLTQALGTRFTLNGVIGGTGSLNLNGDGSGGGFVTLSGDNTYTGGTRLNAGRLTISADSNLGASSGTLTIGNGRLHTLQSFASNRLVTLNGDAEFTQAAGTDFTLNGLIRGTGSLTQNGDGTLVLNGANTYTGGTRINAGTLSIDADSSLGASSAHLSIRNATLHTQQTFASNRLVSLTGDAGFTQAAGTDFTLNGVLSGTGSLTQSGSGTLVLNGDNAYTGGTRINAGTLSIDADSSLGARSSSLSIGNGTLHTQQSFASNRSVILLGDTSFTQASGSNFILNGEIGGSGSLTQRGDGALFLSGTNSYTGTTELNSGSLFVNSSITASSQLTTTPATFLGGTGTLPQSTVGGSVSPGAARDSSGTLSIAGNLTTTPTASYVVDFNSSGAPDLIHASGIATLNNAGASTVLHDFIPVVNQPYAILTADGGVNGTFIYPTRSLPLSNISLTYDANNVYYLVTRNEVPIGGTPEPPIVGVPPGEGTPEHPIAITPPQESTGGAVDELPPDNPILGAIVLLPTVSEIRDALDQLSGQIYPSQQTLLLESSHFVRDAVNERLAAQQDEPLTPLLTSLGTLQLAPRLTAWVQLDPHPSAWLQGVGARRKQGDLVDDTAGTFFGIDSRITDSTTLGLIGGYTRSDVDASHGSSTSDNYSLGTYAGTQLGAWSLKAGTTYTVSEIDSQRSVRFSGFSDSPSADYSASTGQVFAGVSYKVSLGAALLEPYADLAWVKVSTEGFTEHGGPAALRVDDNDQDITFSTLGIRPSYTFAIRDMPMKVKGGLGWRHTFGDLEPSNSMAFAPTGTFAIPGVALAEDTTLVSLGLEAALTPTASLSLAYNGQFGSDTQENGLTGLLQINF
ncbi:autotransporter domain-containing protein [Pseudomonas sp. J452]|uniref:autotransporter outer membrane beta-barrel domain-containing protein n=1 Tax=Pseudomonas sp. J452 TaxID=2898441 RepID=UPI0021AE14D9|nr:autotransporter domain-containing protein [Pseudomonas sp. J452]UUY07009.1 autotransporter domain-containing protein [Pseudomonas sp. J452]